MNTQALANYIARLEYEHLPGEVVQEAKLRVLNAAACLLGGLTTTTARLGRAWAEKLGGVEESTLFGRSRKAPALVAAFANGISASVLDYDDGHWAGGHPSSVLFPGCLALGERGNTSGQDFLTAFVGGWETYVRMNYVGGQGHSSGHYGSYAMAAAGAQVLKLDAKQTREALGLAASHAVTSPPRVTAVTGCMVKEGVGWGALTGVGCALLAQEGFIGAPTPLDVSPRSEDPVPESLGNSYEILNGYIKPYPACRRTHAPIEATIRLAQRHGLRPHDVQHIEVEVRRDSLGHDCRRPITLEHCQFSIPFTVAAALVFGQVTPEELSERNLNNPDILRLAECVRLVHNPAYEIAVAPGERHPAQVTIYLRSGRQFSEEILVCKGSPPRVMSWDEVTAKFLGTAVPLLGDKRATVACELIGNLDQLDSVRPLGAALQPTGMLA